MEIENRFAVAPEVKAGLDVRGGKWAVHGQREGPSW